MGPFRVLQLSIVVLMLFGSTWVVRMAGLEPAAGGGTATWLSEQPVLAGVLRADNGDNSDGGGDNGTSGDNGGDNSGADNSDGNNNNSNGNSNSNSNGNSNDSSADNDNYSFELPPMVTTDRNREQPDPGCIEPGNEGAFTSRDGKVTVKVFRNTPAKVRVEILPVIDFLSAPLPPGNLVGLLAYEIRASQCDSTPLVQLPAEMNLSIRYTDLEATGLDESKFVIGHLNIADGKWYPVEKRGNDASSNFTSATISETGFYMVWEQR